MKYKFDEGTKVKIKETEEEGEILNRGFVWVGYERGKFIFGEYYSVNFTSREIIQGITKPVEVIESSNRRYYGKELEKLVKYKRGDLVELKIKVKDEPHFGKILSLPSESEEDYTILLLETDILDGKKEYLGVRNKKISERDFEKLASTK